MWLQLAITGICFALLPAAIILFSSETNKQRKLVHITLALTFELIMFGAFTRLTDSGLGCPDWPGCFGKANPWQSHAEIKAAEIAMPTGPVTVQKAWIEMVHRYLAMAVGLLILIQAAWAWTKHSRRSHSPFWPSVLLFAVCLQGAFGAWTVTLKLQPIIVTGHLLLGMVLLALLSFERDQFAEWRGSWALASLRRPAQLGMIILFVQIALGAWVSTNYAPLACQGFPLCNGQLVPEMDWGHGFYLWRQLGVTAAGDFLPFNALVAVHWLHRSFAYLVAVYLGYLVWRLWQHSEMRKMAQYLAAALIAQIVLGVATVIFSWPLFIAVLHNGGAAMLVLVMSMLNYRVAAIKPST